MFVKSLPMHRSTVAHFPSQTINPRLIAPCEHKLRGSRDFSLYCKGTTDMSAVDLCIRDSFARTCVAQVIACTPLHAGKSSKGGQNGHPQSLSHWAVQLSQSVLYAEGGGQPTDLGTLTVADGGTPMPVIDVQRALSGTIVHTVANEEPIAVGATVTVELDWDRRLDHMQHHTVCRLEGFLSMHACPVHFKLWCCMHAIVDFA